MINRFLWILFLMLQILFMAAVTLLEQLLNIIPFTLFENYMFVFSQDLIQDVSDLREWLFNNE